jgi:signal transduction histidine kinase
MRHADQPRTLGLRQIVVVAVVALGLVTLVVSTALVVLTTSLDDTADLLRQNVRGTRLVREAQLNLFRHERSADPTERSELGRKLRETLAEDFDDSGMSAETERVRDEAKRHVERYLSTPVQSSTAAARTDAFESAVDALDPVADASIARADEARARAARLDKIGNAVGVGGAALMVIGLAFVALWTRTSIVAPLVALSRAMERFGRGDLASRATPRGPTELRQMVQQFNVMGETLERQRQRRIAHLAGVAHDLRNPLAALQMSASLVDADQPLPPEPQVRRAFALARRQVTRLNRMVGDLLDATRIDAGQLDLDLRKTDLREIVEDAAALFKDVSEIHTLDVELPDEPLIVRCDAVRIEQTLSNLLSNAIKYSPRGGHVRVRAYRERDTAFVSVSDEGIGIRESDLDDIWEPFRRTGVSTEAIPGVGLGLWIAKRLADAHHGELTVESTLGRGSTFTLALPMDRAAAPVTIREAEREVPGASPTTVPTPRPAGSRG